MFWGCHHLRKHPYHSYFSEQQHFFTMEVVNLIDFNECDVADDTEDIFGNRPVMLHMQVRYDSWRRLMARPDPLKLGPRSLSPSLVLLDLSASLLIGKCEEWFGMMNRIRQSSVVNFWKATGSSVSTRAPLIEARSSSGVLHVFKAGFECQARPEVSYPMGKGHWSTGIGTKIDTYQPMSWFSQVTLAFMTPAKGLAFRWPVLMHCVISSHAEAGYLQACSLPVIMLLLLHSDRMQKLLLVRFKQTYRDFVVVLCKQT